MGDLQLEALLQEPGTGNLQDAGKASLIQVKNRQQAVMCSPASI